MRMSCRLLLVISLTIPGLSAGIAIAQENAPPGWGAKKEGAEEPSGEEFPALSDSERVRYRDVALALVEAINSDNVELYRQLFTEEGWSSAGPWWQDMFALQKEKFGLIERAYEPHRGYIRVGKLAYLGEVTDGATMLVTFEEPKGGALNFKLDGSGKIVQTDVFIHSSFALDEPKDVPLIYSLRDSVQGSKE